MHPDWLKKRTCHDVPVPAMVHAALLLLLAVWLLPPVLYQLSQREMICGQPPKAFKRFSCPCHVPAADSESTFLYFNPNFHLRFWICSTHSVADSDRIAYQALDYKLISLPRVRPDHWISACELTHSATGVSRLCDIINTGFQHIEAFPPYKPVGEEVAGKQTTPNPQLY